MAAPELSMQLSIVWIKVSIPIHAQHLQIECTFNCIIAKAYQVVCGNPEILEARC